MTIEIDQPRLEALLQQRMASGHFESIEEALLQALESAPLPGTLDHPDGIGAGPTAARQAMACRDEIELEHAGIQKAETLATNEDEHAPGRSQESLEQMFAKVRGLFADGELDFSRDPSPGRSVDLS